MGVLGEYLGGRRSHVVSEHEDADATTASPTLERRARAPVEHVADQSKLRARRSIQRLGET